MLKSCSPEIIPSAVFSAMMRCTSINSKASMLMITKVLIALGLRSACCGEKYKNWHSNRFYCAACERWLTTDTVNDVSRADKKTHRPAL